MRSTGGLGHQADFLRLWGGQAISELGSRLTRDGLAEAIGVRETLFIAAAGVVLSTGWLIASPIRHVRDHAARLESKV